MNLKVWAACEGVGYATARRWFEAGLVPVPAREADGLFLAGDAAGQAPAGVTAVCARVSSAGLKPDLDRQVARVAAWAASQGRWADRGAAADRAARAVAALRRDSPE